MKRSYNYTDRKRINQKDFSISRYEAGSSYEFSLTFANKHNYDFPKSAEIKVEAYVGSSVERFSLGTWQEPLFDRRIPIKQFSVTDEVKFRLKIVNESEPYKPLLGLRESINPVSFGENGQKRKGILPVKATDLGNRLWQLEWDDESSPRLLVNNKISESKDINAIARADPDFLGLVFPSALEAILLKLIQNDALDEEEGEWRLFCKQFTNDPPPLYDYGAEEDDTEITAWVNTIIDAFCYQFDVVSKYKIFKSK